MAAYDPVTATHGGFPVLTWQTCNSENDNGQLFEYNVKSQLIAEHGKCVTLLPFNNFHENLDSCDTWTGLSGAGTYLFAVDCTDDATSQSFSYNSFTGSFSSHCSHNFKLGSVTDAKGNSKAFMTSDVNTFPSAQIAQISGGSASSEAFEAVAETIAVNNLGDPDTADVIDISQMRNDAIVEILSEFLTVAEANEVSNHGCWCTKIMGTNPSFAGNPVDEIDRLCKEWSVTRRCNTLSGGSCPMHIYNKNTAFNLDYTIKRSINSGKVFSCDTVENENNICLKDSCLIDGTYAAAIYEAIKVDPAWSSIDQSGAECQVVDNTPLGAFSLTCVGDAPHLEIEKTFE